MQPKEEPGAGRGGARPCSRMNTLVRRNGIPIILRWNVEWSWKLVGWLLMARRDHECKRTCGEPHLSPRARWRRRFVPVCAGPPALVGHLRSKSSHSHQDAPAFTPIIHASCGSFFVFRILAECARDGCAPTSSALERCEHIYICSMRPMAFRCPMNY